VAIRDPHHRGGRQEGCGQGLQARRRMPAQRPLRLPPGRGRRAAGRPRGQPLGRQRMAGLRI
ncbi:MAG: hypothetical protein AVDCRST_MAG01-01-2524, partial [uncultured Rubrobacteraceae bacterium]